MDTILHCLAEYKSTSDAGEINIGQHSRYMADGACLCYYIPFEEATLKCNRVRDMKHFIAVVVRTSGVFPVFYSSCYVEVCILSHISLDTI